MAQKINPLLRSGDHLIARRFAYTHHGLYMGEGKVLEYIQDGGVTIVTLETFAQRHAIYIREHPNAKFKGAEAVDRGLTRLGENHYNLFTCNCEHFVNWCIDGVDNSRQVDNLILTIIPFYSLFHRSNFIRGCLKIIFDNPASLDAALERINIHGLNVTDPITRARELSEDVFGTKRQGIVNLTAKITSATQISKEYTSWLRYKQHSITSHLAALNRTLSHPAATLHLLGNKLGFTTSPAQHAEQTQSVSSPVGCTPEPQQQAAQLTAPAPEASTERVVSSSLALTTAPALELHAEATVTPPEIFWRRLATLRDPAAHHSWLGSNLASMAALKVFKLKSLDSTKEPLDPDLSSSPSKLPEAVHPDFAEFELPQDQNSTSPLLPSAATAQGAATPAAQIGAATGQKDGGRGQSGSERSLSARLPNVYVHLKCSMSNGEDITANAAACETERASLEHSQEELETILDPNDWHNSRSQKQSVANTTHDYQRSSMGSAYTGDGIGYALSDLAVEVADQVSQGLRSQQRTWHRKQRHPERSQAGRGSTAATTSTTTSVPLLAFKPQSKDTKDKG